MRNGVESTSFAWSEDDFEVRDVSKCMIHRDVVSVNNTGACQYCFDQFHVSRSANNKEAFCIICGVSFVKIGNSRYCEAASCKMEKKRATREKDRLRQRRYKAERSL